MFKKASKQVTKYVKPAYPTTTGCIQEAKQNIPKALYALLAKKRPSHDHSIYKWFGEYLTENGVKWNKDSFHNYYLTIGNKPRHIYASHYDTVHRDNGDNIVKFNKQTGFISTDQVEKGTPLGADDAAGIYIMVQLIKKRKKGHYIFFADEESGGIGSSGFDLKLLNNEIDLIISLDRANDSEVIISQAYEQCASDECGQWLVDELNSNDLLAYDISHEGVFTDSANFSNLIPECLNLSVGYYYQHTKYEVLDLDHLIILTEQLKKIDFSQACIKRDPTLSDTSYYDDIPYSFKDNTKDSLYQYVVDNPDIISAFLKEKGYTLYDMYDYEDLRDSLLEWDNYR